MMSRARVLSVLALFAACGDDGGSSTPDARVADARVFDAPAARCDYTEQSDATNDTTDTGTSESTGITFAGDTIVCGVVEHTHFDGDITVDVDSFTFTVSAETDVVVRLVAPGANAIELFGLDIYDSSNTLMTTLTYYGNHGVASARLPAGTFEILPVALGSAALISSVPYRIEISTDMPDTRCPEVTVGGHTEAGDGAQDDGNDVFDYPSGQPVALTAAADAPEDTNIVLAPDVNIRFGGEAADVAQADKYEDTDTYEIATGAGTNEMTVRLTWPESGADLDWFLYEQNTTSPVGGSTSDVANSETRLTAVKPNTTYWLVVNAVAGTTVPATYNATLCGAQFAAP